MQPTRRTRRGTTEPDDTLYPGHGWIIGQLVSDDRRGGGSANAKSAWAARRRRDASRPAVAPLGPADLPPCTCQDACDRDHEND